jgi:hypothetical protein
MRQGFALLLGLGVGVLLAGLLVAVQLVLLPESWRTERVVGISSVAMMVACVLAAFVWSRDAQD